MVDISIEYYSNQPEAANIQSMWVVCVRRSVETEIRSYDWCRTRIFSFIFVSWRNSVSYLPPC